LEANAVKNLTQLPTLMSFPLKKFITPKISKHHPYYSMTKLLKNTFKRLTLSLHYKALKNNFIKLYKKNSTLSSHLKMNLSFFYDITL